MEIVEMAVGKTEDIKPLIRNTIKAFEEYMPEFLDSIDKVRDYIVDNHIKIIKKLERDGFDRAEAIVIAGNIIANFKSYSGIRK